ncbi:MAG: DUF5615 family PIN-like protein [Cyanobacteria bacterium P01_D01_bin.1]
MSLLKLHLDADISDRSLHSALIRSGHDVTRTPYDWMPEDASDIFQLIEAAKRNRCLVTCNIKDFVKLAEEYHQHSGILLKTQRGWKRAESIHALGRVLTETRAEDWEGRVGWLNNWRSWR